ncbi:hypothetical protein glysoja_010893 [Glycine soja]|nr:hypothetical protein glysoja_010893 [Glycine soja]
MAYQNYNRNNNYYGWRSPSDEYQVTNYEQDSIAEVESNVEAREQGYESTRLWNHSAYKSVDQEAEAFIQYEHTRMELARLMPTRGA